MDSILSEMLFIVLLQLFNSGGGFIEVKITLIKGKHLELR